VRGILLAAAGMPGSGEPVNIARGEEISIKRLAELLAQRIDPSLEAEHAPPRPADVRRHLAAVQLAKERLGFRAEVGFEEGLTRYVEWFRQAYPDPSACLAHDVVRNW
jgi:UDP-glucose 4-epimerase